MAEPVVVEGLVKRYQEITAVAGLSFSVQRGEIFGLLGPNGAGKTTTVECLEGLRLPDEGRVEVLGVTPSPTAYSLKARLGIQLQATAFLPRLTVAETLSLFAALYPRHRDIEELLRTFALAEKRHALVKDLSGGQRQRLAVALALVNDPELLILDEPTAGLDPQARRTLWGIISQLPQEGKTVLLTTHYLEEAEHLCHRVLILDQGKVIAQGPPDDLISQHFRETPIEIRLAGAKKALPDLPGTSRVVWEEDVAVIYSSSPLETIRALMALTEQGKLSISDLKLRRPSLEDVYLLLTGRRIRE